MSLDVEHHGIDAVPARSRTRGWFDLFTMIAGINICLPMMLVGGLLVPRLSFVETVLVGLIGYALAGCFACLAAYPGVEHGVPAAVMSRITLGYPWGTWISSVCSIITQVGWYAMQAELAGLAADGVLKVMTGHSAPLVMIAAMGGLNVVFAVMGFGWMQRLASWSVPALLVLSAWLFAMIAGRHPFLELVRRPGEGGLTFLAAMNMMVSAQIGASFTISDISRYAKSHGAVWSGILLGISPVSAFIMALGALSRLASGEWNPVLGVQSLGLGLPALFLIILATWTTNDKNLYSGGLALTNLFPTWPRWRHTLSLGVVGTALACVRLTQFFTEWLLALGIVFAPLVGMLLADYFLVRARRPSLAEAYDREGLYRYTRGFNLAALAAIPIGVAAGQLVPAAAQQPLVSLAATAVAYLAAMRIFYPQQFRGGAAIAASSVRDAG